MMNPILCWRETKGLTRAELAAVTGMVASQIWAVEVGGHLARVPKRILRLIEQLDGPDDAHRIAEEYVTWRASQAAKVLERLMATS